MMTAEDDKKFGEMLDYLPADEGIIGKHRVGSYDIVTTTERVIFLRKFPPSFIEVHYNDINNLEHVTNIAWSELVNAAPLLAIAGFIYVNEEGLALVDAISEILRRYVPEILNVLPVNLALEIVMALAALAGGYSLVKFLASLRGYFRVSRKSGPSIIVLTGMSSDLKTLIREIEEEMGRKSKEADRLAASGGIPMDAGEAAVAGGASMEDYIKQTLNDRMRDISTNKVVLIVAKSENHSAVVSNMLDILINQRIMGGVYISITKPHEFIMSTITEAGIPADNLYFIDCISLMAGKGQTDKTGKVVFVENPSSLEEVSMYLDRMLAKVTTPKKFLFVDSLSSLLIYNTDKSVKEFTHFLINKIRLENIAGIILTIDKKEAEDMVRTLTPMCDAELRF